MSAGVFLFFVFFPSKLIIFLIGYCCRVLRNVGAFHSTKSNKMNDISQDVLATVTVLSCFVIILSPQCPLWAEATAGLC